MLTFDSASGPGQSSDFDDLHKGVTLPDVIECGENNDVWIRVRRSSKMLELVSKQTGLVATKCKLDDAWLEDYYGLTTQQIGAVRAALKLGVKDAS
jgi:hypothetical protein